MNDVLAFIQEHDKFAIVSHISPDGDTLGCALALFLALKKAGKQASVHCKNQPTPYYEFMPYIQEFQPLEVIPEDAVVVCVDCADLPRTGLAADHTYLVMSIDHHISNTCFGEVNYVRSSASATAEILFDVVTAMKVPLDPDISTLLYVGICTDTNNYTNSNVTGRTFEISAVLADVGVDVNWVTKHLYRTRALNKTKAIAVIIDQIELVGDGRLATTYITNAQLSELELDDAEGLVDYVSDLDGVCVAVFIKESKPNCCKFSLRSNTDEIDVSRICAAFGGGGHKRAAGCVMELPVSEAREKMIAEVEKWMA